MPKLKPGEIALLALSVCLMAAATVYDVDTTKALVAAEWKALTGFMGRTLFEGELPGANDIFVFILLAALIVYILAQKSTAGFKVKAMGIDAGFILLAALVIAVLFVHGGKLTLGRARPDQVLKHGVMYSDWFRYGAHFIADGTFRGSFPSGHTAQAFIAMSLAYVVAGHPQASRLRRRTGWILGAAALFFSLLMGTARCMSLSHWLTDVLGAILFGWLLMHLLYHRVLCVPDRHRYMTLHGRVPQSPSCWELRIGLYLLVLTIGVSIFGNGLHALWRQQALWMSILIPPGILLVVLTTIRIKRLHRAMSALLSG